MPGRPIGWGPVTWTGWWRGNLIMCLRKTPTLWIGMLLRNWVPCVAILRWCRRNWIHRRRNVRRILSRTHICTEERLRWWNRNRWNLKLLHARRQRLWVPMRCGPCRLRNVRRTWSPHRGIWIIGPRGCWSRRRHRRGRHTRWEMSIRSWWISCRWNPWSRLLCSPRRRL